MKKWLLTSLLLMFLLPAHTSFALSCAQMPSTETAYEKYDGIIIGHVEGVTRTKDHNEIDITVVRSFKEIEVNKLTLEENITWGSLNGPSKIGEEYLFFLKKKGAGWENPLCSPTKTASTASKELAFLQSTEIPLKSPPIIPVEPSSSKWTVPILIGSSVGICVVGIMRYVKRKDN